MKTHKKDMFLDMFYGRGFCIGLCKAFCSCLLQKNGDIEKLGHIVGVKQL